MVPPLMKSYELTCVPIYLCWEWEEERGAVVAVEWDLRCWE